MPRCREHLRVSRDSLAALRQQAPTGTSAEATTPSGGQRGLQQSLAMVLAIAIELVVESAQVGFDRKLGIEREHAANMPGGGGLIAKHGRTRRKEGIVELVGATNAPERVGRLGVATGDEERSAEMAPEALWMIGVEAHRLLDQLDALLRSTDPGVQLALLHND